VNPELAFTVLNTLALPWWALWLVAPRSALAQRAASHAAIFIALGLVYTVLLVTAMSGAPLSGFDFEGVRAGLTTPVGFLAGWTHYIAFDLFVGAWIVRESRRLAVEPRVYLFFTLMAGPLGLMSFLVRRAFTSDGLAGIGRAAPET